VANNTSGIEKCARWAEGLRNDQRRRDQSRSNEEKAGRIHAWGEGRSSVDGARRRVTSAKINNLMDPAVGKTAPVELE
jgi:hypothetical protein